MTKRILTMPQSFQESASQCLVSKDLVSLFVYRIHTMKTYVLKQSKHMARMQYKRRHTPTPTLEPKSFIGLIQESIVQVALYGQL